MPLVEMSQQAPSEERVVSSFPDPPSSLYKVYTDDNVREGLAPKPPAPIKGKYHMFGHLFDVSECVRHISVIYEYPDLLRRKML